MTEPTAIQTALRRLTRPDRAPALAATLGFEPSDQTVSRHDWPALGIPPAAPIRTIRIAGTRTGAELVFLGFARNPDTADVARLARALRAADMTTHRLFIAAAAKYDHVIVATFGLEGELRHLSTDRRHPRASDLETLAELAAHPGDGPTALAVRHARALDRARVTRQFFDDVRARRDAIALAWRGIPRDLTADREQLALLLLCRFMFLYFLQRRGHLADDPNYLAGRLNRWRRNPGNGSFYRNIAVPLFFGALNTRPEHRTPEARALGRLPFLNGGLFEIHALERRHPRLDLTDAAAFDLFDLLLERYRFTTSDAADDLLDHAHDVGIDPEMLGRVFEGLMAADRRGSTGTFYTPSRTVDSIVAETLATYLAPDDPATAQAIRTGDLDTLNTRQQRRIARSLQSITVLDPACGSGAFLLGALSRIAHLRSTLAPAEDPAAIRRHVVGHTLHGLDLQGDAALLCALRLWLALAASTRNDRPVPPLPNLDRQVRQGDALLDPLDLGLADLDDHSSRATAADRYVRAALLTLRPLSQLYLAAESGQKDAIRQQLLTAETNLALAWIRGLDLRLERLAAELTSTSETRDLFGEQSNDARHARTSLTTVLARRAELARLTLTLQDDGTLPFFSFPIHFSKAAANGFDVVISNPPWIRAHNWPPTLGPIVRRRYQVCKHSGWKHAATITGTPVATGGQVDLSLLFLERGLSLLRHNGTLGMILPAKIFRSLYAAPARNILLTSTRIASIEDHSLDQRSIFRADAFAGTIVATKCQPDLKMRRFLESRAGADPPHDRHDRTSPNPASISPPSPSIVQVTLVRKAEQPLHFSIPQDELPLIPGDNESPWLLVPPDLRKSLRKMQQAGPRLGESAGLHVRRGVFTGANDVLLVRECKPRLGGLAHIRTAGYFTADNPLPPRRFEGIVEDECLRPIVRGADVSAWRFRTPLHVIWTHGDGLAPADPPPRLASFLKRHAATLDARSGTTTGTGRIFRVSPETTGPKVAWHDLADQLGAVAIPATIRSPFGTSTPVVPLNTVYFLPAPDWDAALVLTALLNSLPLRTFARAIAERAKDARFRFFAWTIAVLPLPADWIRHRAAAPLALIARQAHANGGIEPHQQATLDRTVAALYGLDDDDSATLRRFDTWLQGRSRHRSTQPIPED